MSNELYANEILEVARLITLKNKSLMELSLSRSDEWLNKLVFRDDEIGAAAKEYINAKSKLHCLFVNSYKAAAKEYDDFIPDILEKIFSIKIPGEVTLPLYKHHGSATFFIEGITNLRRDLETDSVSGIVEVSSHNRRSKTTQSFVMENGKTYFLLEDL